MGIMSAGVVRQIDAGVFDKELADLEKAIQMRIRKVRTTRSNRDFGIGSKVVFNDLCGTKYLHGAPATVTDIKQKKLVVKLDKPVGRFVRHDASGNLCSVAISVPPSIVDLV
jgi:hypothetical protein